MIKRFLAWCKRLALGAQSPSVDQFEFTLKKGAECLRIPARSVQFDDANGVPNDVWEATIKHL